MSLPECMTVEDATRFLKKFIHTINTQDNRGTASPYYFVLQERQETYTSSDVDHDTTREEREDFHDDESPLIKRYIKYHWEDVAFSFTEKGIEEHLACNRHNYKETRVYVKHAFRNSEINQLLEAVSVMAGEPWEKR